MMFAILQTNQMQNILILKNLCFAITVFGKFE